MKPSDSQDVKLTALALGELEATEAAQLEAALHEDPSAREHVREIQALADVLQAALAAESSQGNASVAGADSLEAATEPSARAARVRWFRAARTRLSRLAPVAAALAVMVVGAALVLPTVGKVRESSRRSVDQSNLRQVGQSFLIASNDFPAGKVPDLGDVREVAEFLARHGGLNDATIWLTPADAALPESQGAGRIVRADRTIEPAFRSQPLSYAIALPMPESSMPATTPVAWTRGLRDDGTWAPDSPYAGMGGYIVYLGGNVSFFRSGEVLGRNVRFSDRGTPAAWSEVLPPGRRISEWVPTAEQSRRIVRTLRFDEAEKVLTDRIPDALPYLGICLLVAVVAVLVLYLLGRKRVASRLLILALISIVVLVAMLAAPVWIKHW